MKEIDELQIGDMVHISDDINTGIHPITELMLGYAGIDARISSFDYCSGILCALLDMEDGTPIGHRAMHWRWRWPLIVLTRIDEEDETGEVGDPLSILEE